MAKKKIKYTTFDSTENLGKDIISFMKSKGVIVDDTFGFLTKMNKILPEYTKPFEYGEQRPSQGGKVLWRF